MLRLELKETYKQLKYYQNMLNNSQNKPEWIKNVIKTLKARVEKLKREYKWR